MIGRGLLWLIPGLFIVVMAVLILNPAPPKWDTAIAIRVCGGLPIVRLEDGTMWLRASDYRAYRVLDLDELCDTKKPPP